MHAADAYIEFVKGFNVLGAPYMVAGSVASIVYGEPRLTHDIDLILDIAADQLERVEEVFPLERFYVPPLDVLRVEQQRRQRGHVNIIGLYSGFKADVYFCSCDSLHSWGLQHRRKIQVSETDLWLAPPEYVIVRKLEFFREGKSEKHVRDIRSMLTVSSDEIDLSLVSRFAMERGLEALWIETSQPES